MNKFKINFKIPYFACDEKGNMDPSYILHYLGEASAEHSDSLGLGFKELKNQNYGWVLHRWKVKFINYPKIKEDITIETWTSRADKFYANREFVIYNNSGQKILEATTEWIFLNIEKQRPARIPEEVVRKYNVIPERIFENFHRFKDLESIANSIEYFTRKSDIDYNHHVNNVKYLDWILGAIDDDVLNNYVLKKLEIQYKREILYGDTIESSISGGNFSTNHLEIFHQIKVKDRASTNTYAKTVWEKAN